MTSKKENTTMDRRELLKALAATGGAVTAATMLPGKWTKPVIEAGVLPAHAATSQYMLTASITSRGSGIGTAGRVDPDNLVVEVTIEPAEAGVEIVDQITGDAFSGGGNTETTDGGGKAIFTYGICDYLEFGPEELNAQGCSNETFTITYKFNNQGTYGPATDSVSDTLDPCNCPQ